MFFENYCDLSFSQVFTVCLVVLTYLDYFHHFMVNEDFTGFKHHFCHTLLIQIIV